MAIIVPESHRDLMEKPVVVIVTTVSPDGKPYAAAIWRGYDGEHILMVTGEETRKYKNLLANPNVSVLALDPQNPYRYLEVRGVVESMKPEGAIEYLDQLTMDYMGKSRYFGEVEPVEEGEKYRAVLLRIKPTQIVKFG